MRCQWVIRITIVIAGFVRCLYHHLIPRKQGITIKRTMISQVCCNVNRTVCGSGRTVDGLSECSTVRYGFDPHTVLYTVYACPCGGGRRENRAPTVLKGGRSPKQRAQNNKYGDFFLGNLPP